MTNTPTAEAKRAAETVCNKWSVGEASQFCDDRPDWDSADPGEVASVIDTATGLPALLAERTALREALAFYSFTEASFDDYEERILADQGDKARNALANQGTKE